MLAAEGILRTTEERSGRVESKGEAEFKLELEKQKIVELAELRVQKDVATEQAKIMGEALKSANIDIVGGEIEFFDKITSAITTGKAIDRSRFRCLISSSTRCTCAGSRSTPRRESNIQARSLAFAIRSRTSKRLASTASS